jgi:hypothetical protein
MKLQKLFFSFGMIGALSFLLEDFLGTLLWKGYNPITSYVSLLTADGAPNLPLTRTLFYMCQISLAIFVLSLLMKSLQLNGNVLKIGYFSLLVIFSISILGYGLFPMTMDFIVNIKNYYHFIVTIIILTGTIFILFLLAFGYFKQEHERKIGSITFIAAILFLLFNLLHFYAILNGLNILGLAERLILYTFQIYVFALSWNYVRNRRFKTEVH